MYRIAVTFMLIRLLFTWLNSILMLHAKSANAISLKNVLNQTKLVSQPNKLTNAQKKTKANQLRLFIFCQVNSISSVVVVFAQLFNCEQSHLAVIELLPM